MRRQLILAAAAAVMLARVAPAQTATFSGTVTDSTNKPITNAQVTFPDLGKGTATDEKGAFAIRDVPAGEQRVQVRHVGYGVVETRLTFASGQTLQQHFTMVHAATLDSVVVSEKSTDHALDDFEANRKLGLGHFLTRAELAPQEGRSLGAVLTTLPGIKVFVRGPYAWVGSARGVLSLESMRGVALDKSDTMKQAPISNCYALIYMDNQLVWRGQKYRNPPSAGGPQYTLEPLFDINTIQVADIEAIEYYASPAQTPMKYAGLNSDCGVLVIHTLRFHPKDTTSASPKPPFGDPR